MDIPVNVYFDRLTILSCTKAKTRLKNRAHRKRVRQAPAPYLVPENRYQAPLNPELKSTEIHAIF